eukprot:15028120-Alexandrium_andersonii.AAC.1
MRPFLRWVEPVELSGPQAMPWLPTPAACQRWQIGAPRPAGARRAGRRMAPAQPCRGILLGSH